MIGYRSSPSHRCDEFPAEYSSASCSPAELASASSAALILQLTTLVRRANLSERQPGNSFTVSAEGFTPNNRELPTIQGVWLSRAVDRSVAAAVSRANRP